MAFSFSFFPAPKRFFLIAALISIVVSCCKSDSSGADFTPDDPAADFTHDDPAQLVAKALLCFNNHYIYSSCDESYRLSDSGNINVSPEETDQYCNGPCLEETNLVLDCIDGILSNFLFYNKATVQDIRETISSGCGDTSERGNFNVAQHMQNEEYYGNHAYSDKSHLMQPYLPVSLITLLVFLF